MKYLSLGNTKKRNLSLIEILYLYRYSTLFVISVFFLIGDVNTPIFRNLFVVGCITVSAILLNYFYKHFLNNSAMVITLLMVETVFNASILVPLGGLESPYIWYSLNTIVIASVVLKKKIYCWINLIIYVFCSTFIFSRILNPEISFVNTLQKEQNFILSLILITGAIQILSSYFDKMESKNRELNQTNNKVISSNIKLKESMDYIMELYQAVHLMTTQQDKVNLINTILEYTKKITKSDLVFFIGRKDKGIVCEQNDSELIKKINFELDRQETGIRKINNIVTQIEGRTYILVPILCQCEVYGYLGAEEKTQLRTLEDTNLKDQLKFLSELGTISLDKFQLEHINRGLLINEEQNRIANEIHDGVLQRLFAISCGIFSLKKKAKSLNTMEIESELTIIQSSINNVMGDLRSTIYGYSWKKNGADNFLDNICKFIHTTRKLHGVDINFETKGNLEIISSDHKKAFYRMISEGVGNAIRHGNATYITIFIDILDKEVLLKIDDNGKGFDLNILEQTNKQGLGVRNIKTLTASLNGSFQILSELGKGTSINIKVPVKLKDCKEEFYESVGC